ncbi:hypothetical protein M9H77_13544 [Catharanthus roseus]|uniref:Uncharacterized protein n=1 Tax=Catharanthus roseus TaxID=4058 RepID=A0ACC0BKJ1_CATRO|nr:hypothetical protein M9H77_13544 [Catharanthus roseus]
MANRSSSIESFVEYDDYDMVVLDDLSTWEFIDPSSSDDDVEDLDDFSFPEETPSDDAVSEPKEDEEPLEFGSPSSDISMQSLLNELGPPIIDRVYVDQVQDDDNGDGEDAMRTVDYDQYDHEYDYDEEYDEDDCYDDDYDLDDELVPLRVSNKFGRQRIRKLGKRACPRMNSSKKLPYHYNRPGCVRGKHGLGVQHAYI